MNNDVKRASFWKDFILRKCRFPNPEKLLAQFAIAELSEFCDCGCNSFKVTVPDGASVEPIAQAEIGEGVVFEVNFLMADGVKTLEILLSADSKGNLSYVEIDCSGNSYPVPDVVEVREPPFHIYASKQLIQ